MPQPTFLRSICTVPVTPGAHLDDQRLWARVFSGWRVRPQSGKTLSALVNTLDGGRFITVRVFGQHLTEVQATAEAVTTRLLGETAFRFPPGTRVALAMSVDGVRVDLTSGQVRAGQGGAVRGFYTQHRYVINVTLAVLLHTLLRGSQVLLFARHRPVIEWERP